MHDWDLICLNVDEREWWVGSIGLYTRRVSLLGVEVDPEDLGLELDKQMRFELGLRSLFLRLACKLDELCSNYGIIKV